VALASADTYVVVVALPDMMAGVGLGLDELQRATPIISGFLLGYIAVLPLIGRLSDLVARQRILLFCLALFVVGSAVTAVSVELPVLVAGRVLQGIGGGGLVPATLALVADLWPPERRGTPLGVVGAVQELGSVLGPLLGAAVLAVSDWRAIFWLNVVLGTVLAAVLALTGGNGRLLHPRFLPTVLGLATVASGLLTLAAPTALASGVTLGIPFVPFAGTSRVATPLGVFTLALFLAFLTPFSGIVRTSVDAQWAVSLLIPVIGLLTILPIFENTARHTSFFVMVEFVLAFAAFLFDSIPGIVLRLSETVLDRVPAPVATLAWFPSPLRDQQLSGDLLWFLAELLDIPILIILIIRWNRIDRGEAKKLDELTDEEMEALTREHLRGPNR